MKLVVLRSRVSKAVLRVTTPMFLLLAARSLRQPQSRRDRGALLRHPHRRRTMLKQVTNRRKPIRLRARRRQRSRLPMIPLEVEALHRRLASLLLLLRTALPQSSVPISRASTMLTRAQFGSQQPLLPHLNKRRRLRNAIKSRQCHLQRVLHLLRRTALPAKHTPPHLPQAVSTIAPLPRRVLLRVDRLRLIALPSSARQFQVSAASLQ